MAITMFKDKYSWLSNMAECEIVYGNLVFKSTEAFYQAMKTLDTNQRIKFQEYSGLISKREGKKLILRSDWPEIRDKVMKFALEQKFSKEPFRTLLINTGDAEIIEGNCWHDNYWGSCTCAKCGNNGLNVLGKLIMVIRANL